MAICNRCLSTLPAPGAACPNCNSTGFESPAPGPASQTPVRQTMVQPLTADSSDSTPSVFDQPDLAAAPHDSEGIRRTVAEPVGMIPLEAPADSANANQVATHDTEQSSRPPSAVLFHPTRRPPTPALIVLDDGCLNEGEVIRIRGEQLTIGRCDGDLRIDNDPDISGTHVQLKQHTQGGAVQWILRDLDSTNGTFVRVNKAKLVHGKELLLGQARYRIELSELASPENANTNENQQDIRSTRVYAPASPSNPSIDTLRLVNVADADHSLAFPASGGVFGNDLSLGDSRIDDPMLNGQHARIRKESGSWRIEDLGSANGCWLGITKLRVTQDMEFQIGEQRFRFLPLGVQTLLQERQQRTDSTAGQRR